MDRPLTNWGAHDRCRWLGVDRDDALAVLGPESATTRRLTPADLVGRDRPPGEIEGSAARVERIAAEVYRKLDGVRGGFPSEVDHRAIRLVEFHGDVIEAIPGDNPSGYRVLVEPICRVLGKDYKTQVQHLGRADWADLAPVVVIDVGGKSRRVQTLGRAGFHAWLTALNNKQASDPAVRDLLFAYWSHGRVALDKAFGVIPEPPVPPPSWRPSRRRHPRPVPNQLEFLSSWAE